VANGAGPPVPLPLAYGRYTPIDAALLDAVCGKWLEKAEIDPLVDKLFNDSYYAAQSEPSRTRALSSSGGSAVPLVGSTPPPAGVRSAAVPLARIACGAWHCLALTATGQTLSWGHGADYRLGHGDESSLAVPRMIDALRDIRIDDIAAGFAHSVFIHKSRLQVPTK